jgi:hypothetical protein
MQNITMSNKFSSIGLRTFHSSILTLLLACGTSENALGSPESRDEREAIKFISSILKAEEKYIQSKSNKSYKYALSFNELGISANSKKYNYQIKLDSIGRLIITGIPKKERKIKKLC